MYTTHHLWDLRVPQLSMYVVSPGVNCSLWCQQKWVEATTAHLKINICTYVIHILLMLSICTHSCIMYVSHCYKVETCFQFDLIFYGWFELSQLSHCLLVVEHRIWCIIWFKRCNWLPCLVVLCCFILLASLLYWTIHTTTHASIMTSYTKIKGVIQFSSLHIIKISNTNLYFTCSYICPWKAQPQIYKPFWELHVCTWTCLADPLWALMCVRT